MPVPRRVSDSYAPAETVDLLGLCCDRQLGPSLGWSYSALLAIMKGKSLYKSILQNLMTLSLSFRLARQRSPTLVRHHNKGLISLHSLQELSCQRPCWDLKCFVQYLVNQVNPKRYTSMSQSHTMLLSYILCPMKIINLGNHRDFMQSLITRVSYSASLQLQLQCPARSRSLQGHCHCCALHTCYQKGKFMNV